MIFIVWNVVKTFVLHHRAKLGNVLAHICLNSKFFPYKRFLAYKGLNAYIAYNGFQQLIKEAKDEENYFSRVNRWDRGIPSLYTL
jgi:hypothetical protein